MIDSATTSAPLKSPSANLSRMSVTVSIGARGGGGEGSRRSLTAPRAATMLSALPSSTSLGGGIVGDSCACLR
jgi:hypothetical protein